MSSSVSSVFLQHLQQARQHEGTVQNSTLKSAKNTPQPTRLGPISFNSNVRKPLSPRPTNVITSPIDIIPSPTNISLTSSNNLFSEFRILNIYNEILFTCLINSRAQHCNLYIKITQPFLILSKSQRSLKMYSQNH